MQKGLLWPDTAIYVTRGSSEELLAGAGAAPSAAAAGGAGAAAGGLLPTVEFRSREYQRLVRISHRQAAGIGGARALTRIEAVDLSRASITDSTSSEEGRVFFAVKHRHTNGPGWVRQRVPCRNALWAAALAGCPVEGAGFGHPLADILPPEAIRDFVQPVASPVHLHSYVEKVLLHLRLEAFTGGANIRLLWWRPISHGVAVLVHEGTGRVLAAPCEAPTFAAAARAVFKALTALQLSCTAGAGSPLQLLAPDPDYERVLGGEERGGGSRSSESSRSNEGNESASEDSGYFEEGDEGACVDLVRKWAAEVNASPWLTDYVLRFAGRRGARLIRYSIDMTPTVLAGEDDEAAAVLMPPCIIVQVHVNEPLSREIYAFPVCSLRFPFLEGAVTLKEVRRNFAKALWFLRKFFSIHVQTAS